MNQWLGSRKASHPYTKGILDKNYVLRSTLQGLNSNMKLLVLNWTKNFKLLPVQTFLPCDRKKGLFGHVVTKSRKA